MVTGCNAGSQSCHIIASAADNNPGMQFWPALKMFRSNAEITALKASLDSRKGQLQNLLMLSAHLHKAWGDAKIAFKPIPTHPSVLGAPNRIAIEFHVLSNVSPGSVRHVQSNDPDDDINFLTPIYDSRTGQRIESGHTCVLESRDADTFLLPSADYLMLQYHLQRVVRATAAAEPLALFFWDDSQDGSDSLALLEEGEEEEDVGKPLPQPLDPGFCSFLIDEAVRQGIIRPERTEFWRQRLYENDKQEEVTGMPLATTATTSQTRGRA